MCVGVGVYTYPSGSINRLVHFPCQPKVCHFHDEIIGDEHVPSSKVSMDTLQEEAQHLLLTHYQSGGLVTDHIDLHLLR